MKIVNSDKVDWRELFLDNQFIVVNYQPELNCPGCAEMTELFRELPGQDEFKHIKFLWVDSRNNPIAEQFIKKKQTPFIAAFKDGFLVECDNISNEEELRAMIGRLMSFKLKL